MRCERCFTEIHAEKEIWDHFHGWDSAQLSGPLFARHPGWSGRIGVTRERTPWDDGLRLMVIKLRDLEARAALHDEERSAPPPEAGLAERVRRLKIVLRALVEYAEWLEKHLGRMPSLSVMAARGELGLDPERHGRAEPRAAAPEAVESKALEARAAAQGEEK